MKTLEEYLAVPYVVTVVAVKGPDGRWLRQAEYPEFPGCSGQGLSPEEALANLERDRHRIVGERFASGEEIPVPRPPLQRLLKTAT